MREDHYATFERLQPVECTHVASVIVRSDGWVHSLELWRAGQTTPFNPTQRLTDRSFITSLLQKAIRRGNTETAASAALELAHFDAAALARRLPILAVEDVSSDRNLPAAVWLMLAFSRGVLPCSEDVVWMVLYSAELADSLRRDERFRSGDVPMFNSTWRLASSSDDHTALALVVRAAFGGMRGDVAMLLRAANADHTTDPFVTIRLRDVKRLTPDMVIPAAVDFHCEPNMLDAIAQLHGVERDRVRAAIWYNSSAYNYRTPHATRNEIDLWSIIANAVSRAQAQRIKRAFVLAPPTDSKNIA